jgi:DNA segregation ATPase FtsK/SpoIIIE, S-DNA-T family
MADPKPVKPAKPAAPKSKETDKKTTPPKPAARAESRAPAGKTPSAARKKTASQSSVKLVKRTTTTTVAAAKGASGEAGAAPGSFLDPEYLARKLHQRPGWLDEVVAVLFIVFGMVSLLSLLNSSQTAVLSNLWSDTIRQLFGQGGAVLLSVMIMGVGVLILLPKIGIVIQMPWQRILTIEVAYFAFLAVLHLLVRDTEPRALARSGQGGGYIGWALSDLVFKLFGSGVALMFFASVVVISIAMTFGVKRMHVRKWLQSTNKRLESLSERMKREPAPRPAKGEKPMAQARGGQPAVAEPTAQPQAQDTLAASDMLAGASRRPPAAKSTSMARPLLQAEPGEEAAPSLQPASRKSTPIAREGATGDLDVAAATPQRPARTPKTTSKPAMPAIPPRPSRYFTVADFKEVRQPLQRDENLPPITLLGDIELNKPTEQEVNTNVQVIEKTLIEFDIDVEVIDVKVGPTVTQYAVQPFREVTNDQGEVVMQRVRVNKIASLSNDLALALSAKRLRIQPYVPGHPYMGIEVPNRMPSTVALRPVMESEAFAKVFVKRDAETSETRESPLAVPLGRDVSGGAFVVDLAAMPHLLIAGTTGSGKSVCITALAVSLIMTNLPERLKLVLLDPKMVELSRFNGLPHLLGPVETDMERIVGVLRWATREMDRRYKLLEAEACRNIETYNKALGKPRQSERLPYIVIMVDEIGDLMLSRPDEMERTLTRLAQMARAVGIHLVVATQRPSVDIITGLIKANFPARISFAVASGVDSRVILDSTGAETLMGRGDMLYLAPDASGPQRLQGCFVSDQEIDAVVSHWKDWSARQKDSGVQVGPPANPPWEMAMTRRESLSDMDPLLEDTIDLVVREGEASASLIQRRLGIGYPRAAQLLDMLVELGVAGSLKEGGRTREVLMKPGTDPYKKLMDKRKK